MELGVESFVLLGEGVLCFLECEGFPVTVLVYTCARGWYRVMEVTEYARCLSIFL